MSYRLSKSKYCSGVQCPKMLWLKEHKPEAYDPSCMNQSVLETGSQVGDLAMGLFGEFTEVPYSSPSEMVQTTAALMEQGVPVIAEASFSVNGCFCSVDILKCLGGKDVALYEVKSSTEMKDIYRHDAAFQCHVLQELGYRVVSCHIVHINNQYVRHGELDLHQLFTIVDITEDAAALQPEVTERIVRLRDCVSQPDEPTDDIGVHCFAPYTCGFFAHCTAHLPTPNVFDVGGIHKSKAVDCYRKGLISFADLNTSDVLSAKQHTQVEHELHDYAPHIDKTSIREFLKTLTYPIYFFDFESFMPAVPPFDDIGPFKQVVFQYSLHYIENEDAPLLHTEYLAYPDGDPRRALAEQMCRDIPKDVCVVAYNMGFEKGRIKELAALYPDLREHLMNIHDHIVDLMIPFQRKWYYCRAMRGSYSIKYVLPALFPDDPELDYHNLEGVHNGGEASAAFAQMANMTPEELEATRRHLLAYCGLDTYALVKVWQKLKDVCK